MKWKQGLLLLIISFTLQACSESNNSNHNDTNVATTNDAAVEKISALYELNIKDSKGDKVDMSALKGKKVFLNLWASWCPPCKVEMPSIQKLYDKVDKDHNVFILLSLDNENEQGKALEFMKEAKLNLPVFYPTAALPQLFNVQGIPATFIFDEEGNLIERIDGMEDYEQQKFIDFFSNKI